MTSKPYLSLLFVYTKMRNIAGISTAEAKKSYDMFAKCQYISKITMDKGITFATGTPISNSMTELYTNMRYLQYNLLLNLRLGFFDAWAANFGEIKTVIELAPEGTKYQPKTRFSRFYNLSELMSLFRECADIQTAEMLNLPRPKAEYINVVLEPRPKPVQVVASSSCFVPKPFTPFQWDAQNTFDEFLQKAKTVKKHITKKQLKYNYHDAKLSSLEGVIARGDRKIAKVLYRAWQLGCKFDGWSDLFDYTKWMQAFEDTQIDPAFYANRERSYDEILPWDHISVGVSKQFLMQEREKALKQQVTPNCRQQCSHCGAKCFGGGVCYE